MRYVPLISSVVAIHNSRRKSKQMISLLLNFMLISLKFLRNYFKMLILQFRAYLAKALLLFTAVNPIVPDDNSQAS